MANLAEDPVTRLGLDWEIGTDSGWRIYGAQLVLAFVQRGTPEPVLLAPPLEQSFPALVRARLGPMFDRSRVARSEKAPGQSMRVQYPVLRALANQMQALTTNDDIKAPRNIGMLVFEDTHFDRAALARSLAYDYLVTPSEWNAQIVRGYGLDNVGASMQGVDPTIFHPAPRAGLFSDRFVIFSGGKLEYRKGQDLVVAAFRRFLERHSDAMLLTAWHNHWPGLMAEMGRSGLVQGQPRINDGRLEVRAWLADNGVPADAVVDIGLQPNVVMGQIIREADVAVFPNRCEGGTNLVAMEAMACGVPTILSANTGHLDLLGAHCYPLTKQLAVPGPTSMFRGTDGWGESDVDEIVEVLESVYTRRQEARERGEQAAAYMRNHSWGHSAAQFLRLIEPVTR